MKNNRPSHYQVGIDLGTTNAVVAYLPCYADGSTGEAKTLPIGQWTDQGQWQELPLLPTYRYHLLAHEQALNLPMPFEYQPLPQDQIPALIGRFALKLGIENRGQGVGSAKSWLSQASRVQHSALDAFLPIGTQRQAQNSVALVSPVIASASYLNYLHHWWNAQFAEFPLAEQAVVLTLPASFDEYARDLTRQAAEIAGLPNVQLFEEPTAALSTFLNGQTRNIDTNTARYDSPGTSGVVCVVDLGGGTLDLSLVDLRANPPVRLAVGEHIMLGGDNLDAAVAQQALAQFQGERRQLSPSQWAQLLLAAQQIKEQVLADTPPEQVQLALLGRGQKLFAQQQKAVFDSELLAQQLLDGFLPTLDWDEPAQPLAPAAGVIQVGLEFAKDPAISRHILGFLRLHKLPVDMVLCNGGPLQSERFQQRLIAQFNHWSAQAWQNRTVVVLNNPNPQEAVAKGAALSAPTRSKAPQQRLVTQNAPRHLFLQVQTGDLTDAQAVCVVYRGMPEGEAKLLQQVFELRVNQDVAFVLYSSQDVCTYELGQTLEVQERWQRLPLMHTRIEWLSEHESESQQAPLDEQASVQVQLRTEVSLVGALQLSFLAQVDRTSAKQVVAQVLGHIEFAGRGKAQGVRLRADELPAQWPLVINAIEQSFGPKRLLPEGREPIAHLRRVLEQVLGPKEQWSVVCCRTLADRLLTWQRNRRRSAKHEALWLQLVSFGLRPGFGVVGDDYRLGKIAQVLEQLPGHHQHEVWLGWWLLVRRIQGGMSASEQTRLWTVHAGKCVSLCQLIQSKRMSSRGSISSSSKSASKSRSKTSQLSRKEQDLFNMAPQGMLRALSALELSPGREELAQALFKLWPKEHLGVSRSVLAWCYAQLVSRHSAGNHTEFEPLPVAIVTAQITSWLAEDWRQTPELGLACAAGAQVHATAGVDPKLREQVELRLIALKMPAEWIDSLYRSGANMASAAVNGETLPLGIRLHAASYADAKPC